MGDPVESGRSQHQGKGQRAPEQRCADVDIADGPQHAGLELEAAVGGEVTRQRQLGFGAAVDVVEHAAGQPPPGHDSEVLDAGRPGEAPLHRVDLEAPEPEHRSEGFEHPSILRKPLPLWARGFGQV